MTRLIVFAPNWLGDAVMALPALDDLRRAAGTASLAVAARPSVAPIFSLIPWVSTTIVLPGARRGWPLVRELQSLRADIAAVRQAASAWGEPATAVLLPNSFRSALVAARAGIAERWGYRTDRRGVLLTRAVERPAGPVHQGEYYQHLMRALDCPSGPLAPHLDVGDSPRAAGMRLLNEAGWDGRAPLVALAPGAAYGGAKRWPAASYGALATRLRGDGAQAVLVGGGAEAGAAREIRSASGEGAVLDLVGRTDLQALAGVLVACRGIVSNDSGAMHLAAAIGLPVVAVFGPTNERATSPLPNPSARAPHQVLTADVDCRPCMLRECPIDHRCMHRVTPDRVYAATRALL